MMVMAVTIEGLPDEEHRLSLPPSPVRFRPHRSDWLPSTWDKLSQEAGAGEQLPGAKGSEQSLVFPEPMRLSMVLKACCGLDAGSNWEHQDFLGFRIPSLFLSQLLQLRQFLTQTSPGGTGEERQPEGNGWASDILRYLRPPPTFEAQGALSLASQSTVHCVERRERAVRNPEAGEEGGEWRGGFCAKQLWESVSPVFIRFRAKRVESGVGRGRTRDTTENGKKRGSKVSLQRGCIR